MKIGSRNPPSIPHWHRASRRFRVCSSHALPSSCGPSSLLAHLAKESFAQNWHCVLNGHCPIQSAIRVLSHLFTKDAPGPFHGFRLHLLWPHFNEECREGHRQILMFFALCFSYRAWGRESPGCFSHELLPTPVSMILRSHSLMRTFHLRKTDTQRWARNRISPSDVASQLVYVLWPSHKTNSLDNVFLRRYHQG